MYLSLVLFLVFALWQAQTAGVGRLIIVVRDEAGAAVVGVHVGLYHDADDGRQEIGEYVTDTAGQLVLENVAWGVYIVQFRDSLPNGQLIQPAEQQNQGLLDDGSGAANGFGVRFASGERTELFVLTSAPGQAIAIPLFDQAPNVNAPPQPVNPLENGSLPDVPAFEPQPVATTTAAPRQQEQVVVAPSAAATGQPSASRRFSPLVCVVPLVLIGMPLLIGWRRAQQAGKQHAL